MKLERTKQALVNGTWLCIGLGTYGPHWWIAVALGIWALNAALVLRDRRAEQSRG